MEPSRVRVEQEPWGLRLRCPCGTEQCYSQLSGNIALCSTCGAQYTMTVGQAGIVAEPVIGRGQ